MLTEEQKRSGYNPAFPTIDSNSNLAAFNAGLDPTGMSKRFYAACCAMQGLLSNSSVKMSATFSNDIVHDSYVFADKLIAEEGAE